MNYTEQAREALRIAAAQARELGHPYLGTEHLLLALRRVYTGLAGQILASNGVDEESILKVVDELVSPVGDVVIKERPGNSPRLEYILEESQAEAVRFHSEETGTEHMLLALLRDVDCVATRILLTLGISLQKLAQDIFDVIGADPREYQEELSQDGQRRKEGVLEQYEMCIRDRVYLLYGEEAYLKKQYKDRLIRAMLPEGDTMNYAYYEGKGIDGAELIDLAETCLLYTSISGFCCWRPPSFSQAAKEAVRERATGLFFTM